MQLQKLLHEGGRRGEGREIDVERKGGVHGGGGREGRKEGTGRGDGHGETGISLM